MQALRTAGFALNQLNGIGLTSHNSNSSYAAKEPMTINRVVATAEINRYNIVHVFRFYMPQRCGHSRKTMQR